MAAAHFTAIPWEPNTAYRHRESRFFCEICSCSNNVVYAMCEVLRTFLCVINELFYGFSTLRIMGKGTSCRLLRYVGLAC